MNQVFVYLLEISCLVATDFLLSLMSFSKEMGD